MSSPTKKEPDASATQAVETLTSMMNGAALGPFAVAQSIAQEGLRFWAQRAQSHAAFAEAAAASETPVQLFEAYGAWAARMQQDYVREGTAMAEIVAATGAGSQSAK